MIQLVQYKCSTQYQRPWKSNSILNASHKIIFVAVLALSFTNVAFTQLPAELQIPELVAENRMPMRNSAFAFENMEQAKQNDREKSSGFFH